MTYKVPSLYLHDYIRDFEQLSERYSLSFRSCKTGSLLTIPGTLNNTAHYIRSGIIHLSLSHSSGNHKSISLFGPGTIFPLGVVTHENPIDYEMVLTAFTDVEICSFSYPQLRQICVENGELAAEVLEQNCDFIGYLFYQEMNQSYTPSYIRVCDILYLYCLKICPDTLIIPVSQFELANMVGVSIPQLERILKQLREEQIIATSRRQIKIINIHALHQNCSDDLKPDAFH